MKKVYKGSLIGKGLRFAIVISRFNEFVTARLLEGAQDCLERHGIEEDDIEVVWVPGSFEIPFAAMKIAKGKRFDAIICLGTLIRGDTPHFDYIAREVTKGIAGVSISTGVPAIFGIITADSLDQAIQRAGTKEGNKGWQAALFAIEMANLTKELK
ncbi:6,7-dimethyl-8-ribityllumazine synthase [Candidatus Desantisbacteria bacterium CG07_land_8_20_14_0_80_39_15]|uniref:6,7-dimethyl-8-ribityllumazine synthase n=1 Tax=Candidatus Desantisbacteria bacterium CG07_land_8_20_14_0_80_39_15 TaxID=1974549 RepID=A0A2M6ZGB7_9BACT|nr:MAG: 6,7-dimethyl-8-ribityllumazine synthase [Candidatus Desantisbacteria bacterium CG07_land_8_20_14_0_80_39_15]